MRNINPSIRTFYELALPENLSKCGIFFAPFETTPEQFDKLRFERQSFSQWKVQRDFQRLHYRQRSRAKNRKIYILPIGPFPSFVLEKIQGLSSTLFELLSNFVSVFYMGFSVKMLDVVDLNEISCQTRVHPGTGKLQILVGDVILYLKKNIPKDGSCIVGISWQDLYPGDEWNFVLGEASSEDGCAAISFGHHEPKASEKLFVLNTPPNQNKHIGDAFRRDDGKNKLVGRTNVGSSNDQDKEHLKWNVAKNEDMNAKTNRSKLLNDLEKFDLCTSKDERKARDFGDNCQHQSRGRIMDVNAVICSNGSESYTLECISPQKNPLKTNDSAKVLHEVTEGDEGEVTSADGGLDVEVNGQEDCGHFENKFGQIERINAFKMWKFFRVVSHELGHIFGLTHCSYLSCAMNESTSVDEAVNQPLFMCPVCLRKIQKAAGFDVVERYTKLRHFLETLHSDLIQDGLQGKQDNYGNVPGNDGTDDNNELEKLSKAIGWIDSILRFLENECNNE